MSCAKSRSSASPTIFRATSTSTSRSLRSTAAIHISDLPHSGSIKFLGDEDATVAHVTTVKEEAAADVVAGGPAEPEVAKKGKGDADAAPAADAKAAPKKK